MKLAEALILRADYQRRLTEIVQRLERNAKVQEGERPMENPDQLIEEMEDLAAKLLSLIQRINATNASTFLEGDGGLTIADALAGRDVLRLRQEAYRRLISGATITMNRYARTEIKFVATVNLADVQKRIDALGLEHRELDTRIQAANWQVDLIEG